MMLPKYLLLLTVGPLSVNYRLLSRADSITDDQNNYGELATYQSTMVTTKNVIFKRHLLR